MMHPEAVYQSTLVHRSRRYWRPWSCSNGEPSETRAACRRPSILESVLTTVAGLQGVRLASGRTDRTIDPSVHPEHGAASGSELAHRAGI